ncbi:MAG: DUF86 domain-containing protein [Candidatus Desulforudis sp.]|nr:DUF86 domain-containing protein [Desulforudis sp.]
MRMINIEGRMPALQWYLAENPDIVAAYLYGSYGTVTQTVLSDVDLGILLRLGLQARLSVPGFPKTYTETIKLLATEGVIPHEFVKTAQQMVRFRNRAVHLYDDVSPREVYKILQHHLSDFEEFSQLSGSAVFFYR